MNENNYIGILEDDAHYRRALEKLIESQDGYLVSLTANRGGELVELMEEYYVDLLLIDIQLPDAHGNELVKKIKQEYPDVKCVMCTSFLDTDYIISSLANGASGYILKSDEPENILSGISTILQGGAYMSQDLAIKIVEFFSQKNKKLDQLDILTKRENEVLAMLSKGLMYKEVAADLGLSVETIKKHTSHIYQKLQVDNKTEALIIYNQNKNNYNEN